MDTRKVILSCFIVCLLAVVAVAAVMESTVKKEKMFSEGQPVAYTSLREFSTGGIQAVVKGSIYQNGSNMTVVGACQDANGVLLQASTATFTAWFPNGTLMLGPNVSMLPILNESSGSSGRFRIHVTMGSTIGTYLTEMRCVYGDQYALAFGEWQNPEWVVTIGDTYLAVLSLNNSLQLVSTQLLNLSTELNIFQQDVSNNFSQVLQAISDLNVSNNQTSTDVSNKLKEIYNLNRQIDGSVWILDPSNPTYVLGSGQNNWRAVDMVDRDEVMVAGVNGTWGAWDGTSWSFDQVENATWFGVSMLPSPLTYGWLAGRSGQDEQAMVTIYFNASTSQRPVYSPNGGTPQYVNEAWMNVTNATTFVDVKLFQRPNDPGASIYSFLLTDTGHIAFSDDQGTSWNDFADLYGASHMLQSGGGRISEVVENDDGGTTDGFRAAFVMAGGSFAYFDGTNMTTIEMNGVALSDVSLLRDGEAYVVGMNTTNGNSMIIWKYEDGALEQVFASDGPLLPAGIAAVSSDDIWVATNDPAVYYHFDGERWEYKVFAFSQGLGVTIAFEDVTLTTGLTDIVMMGQNGYAVGSDGLIMKFWSIDDVRFDTIMTQLSNLTVNVSGGSLNFSVLQEQIANLTNITLDMNASLHTELTDVQDKIDQMNESLQIKTDNILNNVTYTQLYLETTIYPTLTNILIQLGLIDAKLNLTIQLQNETLNIVNDTSADVKELLNRSDRPRAWTTQ